MKLNLYENDAKIMLDEVLSVASVNQDYHVLHCDIQYKGNNDDEDSGINALFDFLNAEKKSNDAVKDFSFSLNQDKDGYFIDAVGFNSKVKIRTGSARGMTTSGGAVTYNVVVNCAKKDIGKVRGLLQFINGNRKVKFTDNDSIGKLSDYTVTTRDKYSLINITNVQVLDNGKEAVSAKKARDIYDGILDRAKKLANNKQLQSVNSFYDKNGEDHKGSTVYTDTIELKYMSHTISFRDVVVKIQRTHLNNFNENGTDTKATYSIVLTVENVPSDEKKISGTDVNFLYIIFGFIGKNGLNVDVNKIKMKGNADDKGKAMTEIKKLSDGASKTKPNQSQKQSK